VKPALRNDLDARWIPLGLSLPSLHAHGAKTDYRDCSIAISELDTGTNLKHTLEGGCGKLGETDLRYRAFDADCRIDPLPTGERKV